MKINKLKWKNFTCWGNSWQEMNFDKKNGLSLLCGLNGSGKSSVSNLIIYMLYGQLDGFTQKDMPNRINKHFEGEITFESNKHNVKIYRALSPNDFKVVVDGKDIDTAGKNNVQKWLEDEVYGMPYSIFKNAIVLSVNDFKSFVDLSPKEKRDIIDKLFGYHVINVASAKVKEKIKDINTKINSCESSISGYESSIIEINESINEVKNKDDSSSLLEEEFNKTKEELKDYTEKYKNVLADLKKVEDYEDKINEKETFVKNEYHAIKKQLDLYDKGVCPTCGARLDTDEHLHLKEELCEKEKNLSEKLEKIKEKSNKIYLKDNELSSKKSSLTEKINELKIRYASLETSLREKSNAKDEQLENLKSMRDSINDKISPKKKELSNLEKQNKILSIVSDVFSETGLKQYISNIYVPLINDYVSDVCNKLGIPYRVSFTTGYDCEITFMGEEVSYKTLSTGERKKVDIAVTLAFLKIIKTKISDINILFLDEVLSSIDVASCNELLKIFSDFSKDVNLRIYIVHHANLDSTYVDEVIAVEKQNGFSHFL